MRDLGMSSGRERTEKMSTVADPTREVTLDSPLSSASLRYSLRAAVTADGPGPQETRPFGLRFAQTVPTPVRPEVRYCHQLQVAVDDRRAVVRVEELGAGRVGLLAEFVRHYARRTEDCYVDWARRFLLFHDNRLAAVSPRDAPPATALSGGAAWPGRPRPTRASRCGRCPGSRTSRPRPSGPSGRGRRLGLRRIIGGSSSVAGSRSARPSWSRPSGATSSWRCVPSCGWKRIGGSRE